MSIDAVSDGYEDYEMLIHGHLQEFSCWNGREITYGTEPILKMCMTQLREAMQGYGSYIIGNQPIGYCLQGHIAYHKYLQENYPPILLCDEEEKRCPFALHRFMRYVSTGSAE